jgi:hypothetical protein
MVLAQNDRPKPLPDISLNFGYLHGFTDLGLSSSGHTPVSQLGYQLHITQQVIPYMNITFSLFTGKVRGDETIGNQNINFSSSIFSQTIGVEYNFRPLLKTDMEGRQLIRPFIGVAFGAMQFRAKGDLKDAQGRTYYYWSDGKVYNQSEGQSDPDLLVELQRDNEYETDLRDQNNDGLGKYPQLAFTMPINAGVRFQIGKNVGANIHVGYMLNFTDMVDDISEAGSGSRTGSSGNDNSLFASVGLTVFMGRTKPLPRPTPAPAPIAKAEATDTVSVAKVEKDEVKSEEIANQGIATSQTEFSAAPEAVSVSFEEALRQQEERNRRLLDAKLSGRPNETSKSTANAEMRPVSEENPSESAMATAQVQSANSQSSANLEGSETKESRPDNDSMGRESTLEKRGDNPVDEARTTHQTVNSTSAEIFDQSTEHAQSGNNGSQTGEDHQTVVSTDVEGNILATSPSIQISTSSSAPANGSISDSSALSIGSNATGGQDVNQQKPVMPAEQKGSGVSLGQTAVSSEVTEQNNATGSIQTENNGSTVSETAAAYVVETKPDAGKSLFPSEREAMRIEAEKVGSKDVGVFHWADRDKSGKITPDEVLFYIDQLFEGSGELGVAEIQDLIDYYFEQP